MLAFKTINKNDLIEQIIGMTLGMIPQHLISGFVLELKNYMQSKLVFYSEKEIRSEMQKSLYEIIKKLEQFKLSKRAIKIICTELQSSSEEAISIATKTPMLKWHIPLVPVIGPSISLKKKFNMLPYNEKLSNEINEFENEFVEDDFATPNGSYWIVDVGMEHYFDEAPPAIEAQADYRRRNYLTLNELLCTENLYKHFYLDDIYVYALGSRGDGNIFINNYIPTLHFIDKKKRVSLEWMIAGDNHSPAIFFNQNPPINLSMKDDFIVGSKNFLSPSCSHRVF